MSPARTGPIPQRELVQTMIALVDAARAGNSTAHKDVAKSRLRALLSDPAVNFRSSFVAHNLGARRCRYLNSIGFWMPSRWTAGGWTGPKAEAPDDDE